MAKGTKFMVKLCLQDDSQVTRTVRAIDQAQAKYKAKSLWKTKYIIDVWKAKNQ